MTLIQPSFIPAIRGSMPYSSHNRRKLVAGIYTELEKNFGKLELGEFANNADSIEEFIRVLCKHSIQEHFAAIYRSFTWLPEDSFRLRFGEFLVRLAPKIESPTLEVWVLERNFSGIPYIETELELNSWGFFTNVHLSLPSSLRTHSEKITEIAKAVYNTGYMWMEETLRKKLRELEVSLATALYSFIRTAFRAENKANISQFIWFGMYGSDEGYYLLDTGTATAIVDMLKPRKYRSERSPAFHLLNLLGTSLPYEKSIFRNVVEHGDVLDFPLIRAAYASDQPDYTKTEEQMVSGKHISIFPIYVDTKTKLGVGFPTQYKKDILPVIRANKDQLAEIYLSEMQSVHKYISLLNKHFARLDWGNVGEFLGGMAGGLYKSLS